MNAMDEEFFAVGLSEHRLWGQILIPLILKKKEHENFYTADHIVFPSEKDEQFLRLSHTEKEVVKTIDQYSDQHLFRYFSKDKSVKHFQDTVGPEKINHFIRPYIEKRIAGVLELMSGTRIRLFLRDKSRSNIFSEDFLTIRQEQAEPVFSFHREEGGTRYSLNLFYGNNKLTIKDLSSEVICNQPAIIRLADSVFFVRDIEANKIRPFFSKDFISIPKKTEYQYFKKFVFNIVRDYNVHAEGFRINHIEPEKSAEISIENGLHHNVVLVLGFFYNERKILSNVNQRVFVNFRREKEHFVYEKFTRDENFEETYHELLNDLGLISYDQVNYEIRGNRELDHETQVYDLIEWVNTNAADLDIPGLRLVNKLGTEDFYTGSHELIIKNTMQNDWFDIFAVVKAGDFEIPFYEFKKHILEEKRTYRLPNGSLFILPREWFGRFREMFEFGKIGDGKITIHKQHFFIIEKSVKGLNEEELERLERLNTRDHLPQTNLPSKLNAQLRPYQAEGFAWLYYLQQNNLGGCLADDMGLGKTLQTIVLLLKNKEDIQKKPVSSSVPLQGELFATNEVTATSLIVVPASLIHNWKNELRHFAPSLKVGLYAGNQRSRLLGSMNEYDVIISSYHTIRQDIETISGFRFLYVILDESQVIKNPSSKVYKAINILNSDHRLALTGTPIENSLTDLWAQMNFVNEGLLGNLNFFRREFAVPIQKKSDMSQEERLRKMINPFILRRTKEEVARDLPEISDQVIWCNMSDAQRKFYEEEKSSIRRAIFQNIERDGMEKSSIIVLQGLTRLRQAANHPLLVDEDYRDDSGKFSEILRNVDNLVSEGHKVLIFSSFVKHLELLRKELNRENIKHTMLTGASTKREEIVKAFQDNPECKVFLISLKAGGTGLNLTAADYVFILDPWWNPASEEQAVNRAHRIGQEKNVFVFRFISENSIEEKIQHLQEKKTKLAEAFVTSNNPLKNIDRKQLEKLFE